MGYNAMPYRIVTPNSTKQGKTRKPNGALFCFNKTNAPQIPTNFKEKNIVNKRLFFYSTISTLLFMIQHILFVSHDINSDIEYHLIRKNNLEQKQEFRRSFYLNDVDQKRIQGELAHKRSTRLIPNITENAQVEIPASILFKSAQVNQQHKSPWKELMPKCCTLTQPCHVLITSIFSSPLAMGFAIALADKFKSSNKLKLIGVDSLFPDALENRWDFLHKQQILQRYDVTIKLIPAYSGIYPQRRRKKAKFVDEILHNVTHIVHTLADDARISRYWNVREGKLSMQQILEYLKSCKDNNNVLPRFIYISSKGNGVSPPHQAIIKANEVLASTYYSLYSVSSVGLRLPILIGPWGYSKESIFHDIVNELFHNSKISSNQNFSKRENLNLTLMSVNDGVNAIFSVFQNSLEGAQLLEWNEGSHYLNVTSLRRKIKYIWDFDPDSYRHLSKFERALYQAIGVQYYEKYRNEAPPFKKNFAANMWESTIPSKIPCSSECSYTSYCSRSQLDVIAPLLQEKTSHCHYILYTYSFSNEFQTLYNVSTYLQGNVTYCFATFVSGESMILQNQKKVEKVLEIDHWLVVPLPAKDLTQSTLLLLKLSPSKLFSPNAKKAMFYSSPILPSFLITSQMFEEMDVPYKKSRYKLEQDPKNGKWVEIKVPERKAKRITLMTSQYKIANRKWIENPNGTWYKGLEFKFEELLDIIGSRKIADYDEILYGDTNIMLQRNFYVAAYEMIQDPLNPLSVEPELTSKDDDNNDSQEEVFIKKGNILFPKIWIRSSWLLHDLNYGREFRCDAYREQLFWGNDFLEEWSLMFTYARWYGLGKLGKFVNNEIIPVTENNKIKMDENGTGLYLRTLVRPIPLKPVLPQND